MKYLTAKKLKITEKERTALLKVKKFLKTLKRPENLYSRFKYSMNEVADKTSALFYMNKAITRFDCGTACCVGGWMYVYMQGIPLKSKVAIPEDVAYKATDYVSTTKDCNSPLSSLFYPRRTNDYDPITPQQAITQIETFLKTGHATW